MGIAQLGSTKLRRRSRTITATGAFTVPDGVYQLKVRLVGGGGSGACTVYVNYTTPPDYLSGGGAGGGLIDTYLDVTPGQSIAAVIGAGGAAVARLYSNNGQTAGNPGSATTFGSLSAPGGGAGLAPSSLTMQQTAAAGNYVGGASDGYGIPAQYGRDNLCGGAGGVGYSNTKPFSYQRPGGIPASGAGAGRAVVASSGATVPSQAAASGTANTGAGGGGIGLQTTYAISSSSGTMTSGAGATGVVVVEWEEPA